MLLPGRAQLADTALLVAAAVAGAAVADAVAPALTADQIGQAIRPDEVATRLSLRPGSRALIACRCLDIAPEGGYQARDWIAVSAIV